MNEDKSMNSLVKKFKTMSAKKIKQLKQEFQLKLAKKKIKKVPEVTYTLPRYDETFFKGLEWLDSLAGESVPQTSGEIIFSPDIWKSKSRFDPDVSS